jgi:hypothetical protein
MDYSGSPGHGHGKVQRYGPSKNTHNTQKRITSHTTGNRSGHNKCGALLQNSKPATASWIGSDIFVAVDVVAAELVTNLAIWNTDKLSPALKAAWTLKSKPIWMRRTPFLIPTMMMILLLLHLLLRHCRRTNEREPSSFTFLHLYWPWLVVL